MDFRADYCEYLVQMLEFIEEYRWLVDFAVTDLLVSDVFSKIPSDWLAVFLEMTYEDAVLLANHRLKPEWPKSLENFFKFCRSLNMDLIVNAKNDDVETVQIGGEFRQWLSPKKQHEVANLSGLVDFICKQSESVGILDIGSGLGYVDLLLASKGYNVLGLECFYTLVEKANIRTRMKFPNLVDRLSFQTFALSDASTVPLLSVVESFYTNNKLKNVCMVGLHTCGDLTSSSFKMFLNIPHITIAIIMPCCYHKMTLKEDCDPHLMQQFNSQTVHSDFNKFPLSKSLSLLFKPLHRTIFNRPFFRLAAQENFDRWKSWSARDHENKAFEVMSRAALQLYVEREGWKLKKLRRRATPNNNPCNDLSIFIDNVITNYDFIENTSNRIFKKNENFIKKISVNLNSLWNENRKLMVLAQIVLILQMSMQSIAEAFIITDLLVYLQENKYNRVEVVKVFDRKISARHFAVIAKKGL